MSYFWSGSEEMTFEFENLHYWYHSRYEMDPERWEAELARQNLSDKVEFTIGEDAITFQHIGEHHRARPHRGPSPGASGEGFSSLRGEDRAYSSERIWTGSPSSTRARVAPAQRAPSWTSLWLVERLGLSNSLSKSIFRLMSELGKSSYMLKGGNRGSPRTPGIGVFAQSSDL